MFGAEATRNCVAAAAAATTTRLTRERARLEPVHCHTLQASGAPDGNQVRSKKKKGTIWRETRGAVRAAVGVWASSAVLRGGGSGGDLGFLSSGLEEKCKHNANIKFAGGGEGGGACFSGEL